MRTQRGYRNRKERIADLQDRAAQIWQAAYTRALGWESDPEGVAHKVMSEFLANHGID